MKKIVLGLVGLASIFCGNFVYAGGPEKAPSSWTGFYIGGNIGDAWAWADWIYQNTNPYDAAGPTSPSLALVNKFNLRNQLATGFQLGLNFQYQRFVVGPEATFDWANLSRTVLNATQATFPAVLNFKQVVNTSMTNMFYTITARMGALPMPNWLLYSKVGYANTRILTSGNVYPLILGGAYDWGNTGKEHSGWTIGVGTEYRFIKYMSAGIEYNYMSFGTMTHIGGIAIVSSANQVVHQVNGGIQDVVARLNFLLTF